jgi:choline monooxygenase
MSVGEHALSRIGGREIAEDLDRPLHEARGLPPIAYTDATFFEQEVARIFRRKWLGVAFSHELANNGDARPLKLAGVEVLLVRDNDGRMRAFHNVCRHRASVVLQEPAKGLTALRCPYHCWTYNLDGTLKLAPMWEGPRQGARSSLDPKDNALTELRCGEWQDIIFVNLSADAVPLSDYVAPLDQRWKHFDFTALRPFGQRERVIDANWKVVMEGLLEVYHENFVHESLGYRVDAKGEKTWRDIMAGDIMGFEGVLPDTNSDNGGDGLPRIAGMPQTGPVSSDIFLLFPATSINVMETHLVRTLWEPTSLKQTRWRSAWYFPTEVVNDPKYRETCEEIIDFWLTIRSEDLRVVLSIQRGLESWDSAFREIKFSPYWEEIVRHFQRHVVRALN